MKNLDILACYRFSILKKCIAEAKSSAFLKFSYLIHEKVIFILIKSFSSHSCN